MSNTMSISRDKKSFMLEEKQQSYDMAIAQALSLLKENPSEQRLDIRLPYAEYLKLDQCWSKEKSEAHISEDQRYPYLAYNSAIETASVVTVPNQVHEVAAKDMCREIMNIIETYLAVHPPAVGEIQDIGSTTIKGSHGRYSRILKQADGLFKFRGKGFGTRLMVAIEVGFSEMYHALCHDKDLWIDGNHVKVCILPGTLQSNFILES
ncbi:hypothetical protein V1508DRAFT_448910 [Lipomyces doorenjongii]|uniref:uncharacterized protein n=1 Tax=Lipomyces doorenjongii TaxID=383834 RepID=UPI0034CDF5B9